MLVTPQEMMRAEVQKLLDRFGNERSALLPILQELKHKKKYISADLMQIIADLLGIHPVEVQSVVSFYDFLNTKPEGRFVIRLCHTISCDMEGKDAVARQLENDLKIRFGETTPDGMFTLKRANCMGLCDQGPAMMVNDQLYSSVTPEKVHEILDNCRRMFSAPSSGEELNQEHPR